MGGPARVPKAGPLQSMMMKSSPRGSGLVILLTDVPDEEMYRPHRAGQSYGLNRA